MAKRKNDTPIWVYAAMAAFCLPWAVYVGWDWAAQLRCYYDLNWDFDKLCPTNDWYWGRGQKTKMTNIERVKFGMPATLALLSGVTSICIHKIVARLRQGTIPVSK